MKSPLTNHNDPWLLYSGLAKNTSDAILHLHRKTTSFLLQWRWSRRIPPKDLEELAEDAVILTIQKIETGVYPFEGGDPCAYAAGIAKNLVFNFLRKQRPNKVPIQEWDAAEAPLVEQYLFQKEIQELIQQALNSMGDNCRKLISLYHLEGKSDDEVLAEKQTPYTTVESIRSKRSECMKKLRQMANVLKTHL